MLRLVSVLLIVLGLGALGFGGLRYVSGDDGVLKAQSPGQGMTDVREDRSSAGGASAPMTQPIIVFPPPETANLDGDVEIATAPSSPSSVLDGLKRVPVAHETPERARFGRPFDVTLAVDGTGDDSATDALPGRGNIVEGEGFVGAKARATLSGASFDIEATTPVTQKISPLTENVWRWRVTPREAGNQQLILELFALEGDQALPVRTFRDEIEVEVSRFGQAVAIAQSVSPLIMVIGGIGSLLAGLFGAARFFRGH